MRYLATSTYTKLVCDIEGDRLLGEIKVDGIDPDSYAIITLRKYNDQSAAHLFSKDKWALEPLPLGEHRLLSPLDFHPGYYDD